MVSAMSSINCHRKVPLVASSSQRFARYCNSNSRASYECWSYVVDVCIDSEIIVCMLVMAIQKYVLVENVNYLLSRCIALSVNL